MKTVCYQTWFFVSFFLKPELLFAYARIVCPFYFCVHVWDGNSRHLRSCIKQKSADSFFSVFLHEFGLTFLWVVVRHATHGQSCLLNVKMHLTEWHWIDGSLRFYALLDDQCNVKIARTRKSERKKERERKQASLRGDRVPCHRLMSAFLCVWSQQVRFIISFLLPLHIWNTTKPQPQWWALYVFVYTAVYGQ